MIDVLESGRLERLDFGLSMFEGVEVDRWICIAALATRQRFGDDQASNESDALVASFIS